MAATLLSVAAKTAAGPGSAAGRAIDRYAPRVPTNISDLERVASLVAGGALAGYAAAGSGTLARIAAGLAGGALIYRAATGHCSGYALLGSTGGGPNTAVPAGAGVKVEQAVTVNKPADACYRAWRQFHKLPDYIPRLVSVTESGGGKSRWVARGPLGVVLEWDAELIEDRPGEVISWKSVAGADVDTAGAVHFRPVHGGRLTEVRASLKYAPPAGKLGVAVAKLFGRSPDDELRKGLSRFKSVLETGEIATVEGQTSGRA